MAPETQRIGLTAVSLAPRLPHLMPSGFNIRSRTIWFAISPPFCSATAPTIAYNVCAKTVSTPELCKLFTYIVQLSVFA